MSGAPCGGCSKYAPRSGATMPSVASRNWCRKEPSAVTAGLAEAEEGGSQVGGRSCASGCLQSQCMPD